jgi:molybdopterin synthase catalytic subunit
VALPPSGDDWVGFCQGALPLDRLTTWPVLPSCGAVVMFTGTVRDRSEGRPGVACLEYEAYEEAATAVMSQICREMRARWPALGRVALLHRTGALAPCEPSVAVAVSAPHRREAFEAARYGIDSLKSRAPIWKREFWQGGEAWGLDAHSLVEPLGASGGRRGH